MLQRGKNSTLAMQILERISSFIRRDSFLSSYRYLAEKHTLKEQDYCGCVGYVMTNRKLPLSQKPYSYTIPTLFFMATPCESEINALKTP